MVNAKLMSLLRMPMRDGEREADVADDGCRERWRRHMAIVECGVQVAKCGVRSSTGAKQPTATVVVTDAEGCPCDAADCGLSGDAMLPTAGDTMLLARSLRRR